MSIKKEIYQGKPIKDLIERQKTIWPVTLTVDGVVPANSTSSFFKKSIGNLGHFVLDTITGVYDTVEKDPNQTLVDYGRCLLKLNINDLSNQRALFDDFVSCDLFLTPGRRKALADNTAIPNQLFFPLSFPYIFTINTDIGFTFSNRSNADLSFNLALMGLRHRA